ncbi:MAG: RNA polymerase sigma factor [Polyangiaceae bacterium]
MPEVARRPHLVVVTDAFARNARDLATSTDGVGDTRSDGTLVADALRGDATAESALYERHAPSILAVATRLLRSRDDAADVLQDTFVDALESLESLREPDAVRGWLLRIAVHQVHRRFRKRKLLAFLGMESRDSGSFESVAGTQASAEDRMELALLDRALDGVACEDRAAWTLRHVEGHSLPDIAVLVGASLATVKRRIRRAEERVGTHFGVPARTFTTEVFDA